MYHETKACIRNCLEHREESCVIQGHVFYMATNLKSCKMQIASTPAYLLYSEFGRLHRQRS